MITRLDARGTEPSLVQRAVRDRLAINRWALIAVPGLAFLGVFFFFPLFQMAIRSFTDPSPSNYSIFVDSPVYLRTLVTTFKTAFIVTIACLVLGYPYAYVMRQAKPHIAAILGFLVLVPFWLSLLVRSYAWTIWLQDSGLINTTLQAIGIVEHPLGLIRNTFGVTVAMTHILLPYMVLSLYAVMRGIDPDLSAAASGLGAGPFTAFRKVFLPLSMPGVLAGSLLVFVLSLGFYITPALLGSPHNEMISQLIVNQVGTQLQFGIGAAVAMVLLGLTLAILFLGTRLVRVREIARDGGDRAP
jgi:putative spermidine/putrescine transport system permease protein